MAAVAHARPRDVLTRLILEVFKLNGRLLAAGDRLVRDIGLTSARWQVLGAVALAPAPQPVANLARTMGLTRQAVQRTTNELVTDGLLSFAPNPHHQTAQLVVLTKKGEAAYDAADARQRPWARALAEGLRDADLSTAQLTLFRLTERLEVAAHVSSTHTPRGHRSRRTPTRTRRSYGQTD
jgi:DNA-binding MarR family transcriptional regulator